MGIMTFVVKILGVVLVPAIFLMLMLYPIMNIFEVSTVIIGAIWAALYGPISALLILSFVQKIR